MIDAHVHLEKGDYSVEKLKQINFPIRLKFGLEVCYSPEHEIDIAQIKQMYSFDFLVGLIHFIDGWAFSHLKAFQAIHNSRMFCVILCYVILFPSFFSLIRVRNILWEDII